MYVCKPIGVVAGDPFQNATEEVALALALALENADISPEYFVSVNVTALEDIARSVIAKACYLNIVTRSPAGRDLAIERSFKFGA